MVRSIIILLLCLTGRAQAGPIYHSTDTQGRSVYSDSAPDRPHDEVIIEQTNDYDWHQFDYTPPKARKKKKHKAKRKKKTAPKLSFDQLRSKCQTARYRYQNYRGRGGNDDWGKYKAKLIKYSEKRDYWCSRYLRRK
ncbi:DUF4124 domain-containing protein [Sulfuriflexus mobilis]|uniref:DUF4124 domain-containing protein n=1 Tax=Sulfuriflexus mobilis TaxID=1811807 RepID=UPI000F8242C3|nr:DUF4124 domain-containing protein [Sulfuriflexus mobilis]